LIEAVKQGQGLDLLVTALHATQARRQALERDLTTLDAPPTANSPTASTFAPRSRVARPTSTAS
jgi:hypothetical protein